MFAKTIKEMICLLDRYIIDSPLMDIHGIRYSIRSVIMKNGVHFLILEETKDDTGSSTIDLLSTLIDLAIDYTDIDAGVRHRTSKIGTGGFKTGDVAISRGVTLLPILSLS